MLEARNNAEDLIDEDPFCRLPARLADEPFIFISNHKANTMRAGLQTRSNRICVPQMGEHKLVFTLLRNFYLCDMATSVFRSHEAKVKDAFYSRCPI